jgi:hypothetical protein
LVHIFSWHAINGNGQKFPFHICLMKIGNKKDSSYIHLNCPS